jgi:hypothetical protein
MKTRGLHKNFAELGLFVDDVVVCEASISPEYVIGQKYRIKANKEKVLCVEGFSKVLVDGREGRWRRITS